MAPDSIVVIDESGHRLERSAAVAMIVGEWRFGGGPIAAVMRRLERPLDALYVVVAGNRHALGAPLRVGRRLVALIRR